ncbi:MAG: hypothetical protein K8F60_03765 [Melioribacteraceae bacterium]|nr:hypothetical protein [Melioribacteraceae bacterium]
MRIKLKINRIHVPKKPSKIMEKMGREFNRYERKKSKNILKKFKNSSENSLN